MLSAQTDRDQIERDVTQLNAALPTLTAEVTRCEANRDDIMRQCDKAIDGASAQLSKAMTLHTSVGKIVADLREAEGSNPRGRLEEVLREETKYVNWREGRGEACGIAVYSIFRCECCVHPLACLMSHSLLVAGCCAAMPRATRRKSRQLRARCRLLSTTKLNWSSCTSRLSTCCGKGSCHHNGAFGFGPNVVSIGVA